MKILIVPIASLAVIGTAALLTTTTPAPPAAPVCEQVHREIVEVPLEPLVIERHHFAKPPPGPRPQPGVPHATVTA